MIKLRMIYMKDLLHEIIKTLEQIDQDTNSAALSSSEVRETKETIDEIQEIEKSIIHLLEDLKHCKKEDIPHVLISLRGEFLDYEASIIETKDLVKKVIEKISE